MFSKINLLPLHKTEMVIIYNMTLKGKYIQDKEEYTLTFYYSENKIAVLWVYFNVLKI